MDTNHHIVVVDDSEIVRETTEKILVDAGYSVTTAGGAPEALLNHSKSPADLFLIDIVMPDVNGLTLLKELKVFDNTYEAIMITGHESIDDAATAMELGAFGYIRKPIKRADLLDHVQKALAMVRMKKSRFDHLRHLETLKNSFLSVAAHELRTPVNILMNYLSLLRTNGDDRDMRTTAIEDMRCANNRLKYLVNGIISFVTLSARDVPVYKTTVDVEAIIREEMEKLGNETREKNVGFDVSMTLESPRFDADPDLLKLALGNVLSNAVKYNRENGRVRINVKDSVVKGAQGISIEVSDEGEGISKRAMSNLFESFIQGEDPMTRSHSGLGTGLFLAKRAVQLLGGEIRAESLEGRGSRFTIEIPDGRTGSAVREKAVEEYQF
jgi:signal transduction histidine kinase